MTDTTIIDQEKLDQKSSPSGLIKTLIIVGAIFGIHPFAIIISFPLYFSGVTMLWVNKKPPKKSKLKWTIYPILGILSVWAIIVSILTFYEYIL